MSLPNSSQTTFGILTGLGFFVQWVIMVWNGSFFAMLTLPLGGVFPSGLPIKTSWTGFWLIDYILAINVVFFGVLNNVAELPDLGPYLSLLDISFFLLVLNMMSMVEDRRNRKTGPLRYPGLWQFYRSYGGVAFTLPIYLGLYLKKRSGKCLRVPNDQAQALPLTALWLLVISFIMAASLILDASVFDFQDAVVLWHVAPITVGIFQDFASLLFKRGLYKGFKNPVKLAYLIAGSLSAVGHMSIIWHTLRSPELTLSHVFWPDHSVVQGGASLMGDGATLFLQYDHVIINLCIIVLGGYMLNGHAGFITFIPLLLIAGPGAALSRLLYQKENELDNEDNVKKVVY